MLQNRTSDVDAFSRLQERSILVRDYGKRPLCLVTSRVLSSGVARLERTLRILVVVAVSAHDSHEIAAPFVEIPCVKGALVTRRHCREQVVNGSFEPALPAEMSLDHRQGNTESLCS